VRAGRLRVPGICGASWWSGQREATMRLTTMTQITVDGVIQANGGASAAERAAGFTRDGWAMQAFDETTFERIQSTYQRAAAFLFGRVTYELFQSSWGTDPEMQRHPIGVALSTAPKYVVSDTLTEGTWPDTTVVSGDVLAGVRALKEQPGGDLQVHGSAALVRWLLANDLVDEMTLLVVPVVLGQGTRLFPQDGPDTRLELVESVSDTRGATTLVYRPVGRPTYHPVRTD
jgi:dihydrofolate reductase